MGRDSIKGKLFPLFLLAASSGIFNILYVISVFYVPYQQVFGYTNFQMGLLMSIYSWVGTPGALIGGPLSDLWNAKKVMVVCCIVSALCGLGLATIPPFPVAVVIYIIMPIPMTWFAWTVFNKCIAVMAIDGDSGRLYGLASTFDCIITLAITMFPTLLFGDRLAERNNFRMIFIIMASVYLLAGILLHFFFDYDYYAKRAGIDNTGEKKFKLNLSEYKKVITSPVPWLCGFLVMGMYITATGFNYLSPYLNAVYAIPVGLASAFAIIIRYAVKACVNPLGGWFRDTKLGGSTPKLVWTSSIMVFIVAMVLVLLPKTSNYGLLATIIAILLVAVFRFNSSSESTCFRSVNALPMSLIGSCMGLGYMIAYSTDMWLPTVIGNVLDKNGNDGFKFIFFIIFFGMALASVCAFLMYRLQKKEAAKKVSETV